MYLFWGLAYWGLHTGRVPFDSKVLNTVRVDTLLVASFSVIWAVWLALHVASWVCYEHQISQDLSKTNAPPAFEPSASISSDCRVWLRLCNVWTAGWIFLSTDQIKIQSYSSLLNCENVGSYSSSDDFWGQDVLSVTMFIILKLCDLRWCLSSKPVNLPPISGAVHRTPLIMGATTHCIQSTS